YLGDRNRHNAPRSFRLEVDSAARFGDPYSPTHQVQVTRRDNRLEVTLADGAVGGPFELLLPLARGLVGLSLMPHHPVGEDGYFMLLLAPGAAADAAALRRDVVAVIDVSGSMSGEQGRGRFRVFSFGVGDDVNTYLLDRLTERARGATEYIRPGENIERAVGALAAKVASPVLTDVTITASSGVELYDVQPGSLPDLFAGDEMVVLGRYRGVGSGEWSVTVQGRRNGRQEEFRTSGGDRENADARYIEQLWASRKVGALSREIRLHGQTQEIMNSLKQLALRYGILTEYTSYLVQEPNIAMRQRAENRVMQAPAPAPVDQAGAASVGRAAAEKSMADAVHLESVVVTVNGSELDEMRRANSGIN